jgi:hypothetical protein
MNVGGIRGNRSVERDATRDRDEKPASDFGAIVLSVSAKKDEPAPKPEPKRASEDRAERAFSEDSRDERRPEGVAPSADTPNDVASNVLAPSAAAFVPHLLESRPLEVVGTTARASALGGRSDAPAFDRDSRRAAKNDASAGAHAGKRATGALAPDVMPGAAPAEDESFDAATGAADRKVATASAKASQRDASSELSLKNQSALPSVLRDDLPEPPAASPISKERAVVADATLPLPTSSLPSALDASPSDPSSAPAPFESSEDDAVEASSSDFGAGSDSGSHDPSNESGRDLSEQVTPVDTRVATQATGAPRAVPQASPFSVAVNVASQLFGQGASATGAVVADIAGEIERVTALSTAGAAGEANADFELSHPELGTVRVALAVKGSEVELRLFAHDAATVTRLLANDAGIRRALSGVGLRVTALRVDHEGRPMGPKEHRIRRRRGLDMEA